MSISLIRKKFRVGGSLDAPTLYGILYIVCPICETRNTPNIIAIITPVKRLCQIVKPVRRLLDSRRCHLVA